MITRSVVNTAVAATLAASAMISLTANADEQEIVDRVKPVGSLVILGTAEKTEAAPAETTTAAPAATDAAAAATPATATADAGKATYDTACFACHGTGAAGAPVLGNKDAWAARISQGKDILYSHAIDGFQAMPPKGGAAALSDEEVKVVVDYMVAQSS